MNLVVIYDLQVHKNFHLGRAVYPLDSSMVKRVLSTKQNEISRTVTVLRNESSKIVITTRSDIGTHREGCVREWYTTRTVD